MSDSVNPFATTDVKSELPAETAATRQPDLDSASVQGDDYSGEFCIVDKYGTVYVPCGDDQNSEVEHDFRPGSVLHERYLLISKLGQGGMGRVMLAQDQLLHRKVAVKIVAVKLREERQSFQDALAREARLGASLSDRGIAVVHDFGIHLGKCFIVFEFVDGQTLRRVLRQRSRLPLAEVCPIITELARSLDFAHARGVVHRDLKPENICIAHDGQPKILDFGVARDLRSDFRQEAFSGTPQYASPEQAACSVVDGRADQYASGCSPMRCSQDVACFSGRTRLNC